MTTLLHSLRPDDRGSRLGVTPVRPPRRPDDRGTALGANPPRPRPAAKRPAAPAPAPGRKLPQSPTQAINGIAGYHDPLEQQAMALVDPLIQSITNRIGAETKAGVGAIGGYANSLAGALGGFTDSAKQIYGRAQQSQAAADAALSAALSGQGTTLANELGAKLEQINAPGSAPADAAAMGTGSANALLATGSAELGRLIGEGAHAQEFAAKQPGIARSQGLSDIRDLELAQQAKLYDQAEELKGQVPGLVEQLRQDRERAREFDLSRADSAATAAERRREYQTNLQAKMLLARMATETDQAKLAQDWQKFQALQSNENARLGATLQSREGIAAENRQAANERAAAANAIRQYQADTARWKAMHPTATAKQASAASRSRWVKMAEDFYHGVAPKQHYDSITQAFKDVPGTGSAPVRYGQALRILMSAGASRAVALQILNSLYEPGEGGRPGPVDIANAKARQGKDASGLGIQIVTP